MNWNELKAKHKNAEHPPKEDCKSCCGTGEIERPQAPGTYIPCICVFIPHDHKLIVTDAMSKTLKTIKDCVERKIDPLSRH